MSERPYHILSTAILPAERIKNIPVSVNVSSIPFTEILAREDENLNTVISNFSGEKITAVFTSAYAVRFVAAMLIQKPDWKIYCIRNETRNAVEKYFGAESIARFESNALLLSQCIIADKIKEVVFFCGDQRLNTLPDNLKKNGIQLTELVVYDTRLTPVLLDEKPDAVLFFSPTAVSSFFSVNVLFPETIVFAMGTTTAEALKQNTNNPVIVSREADKAYVLQMALEYAGAHPII